jgi:hypothetical protein
LVRALPAAPLRLLLSVLTQHAPPLSGIPVVIVYLLYRSRVPDLAVWKRECAWLRNVAQRAVIVGAKTEREFDPDTITTESITLEHLRMLHRLFVEGELDEEGLTRASALPGVLVLPKTLEERSMHGSMHGSVSVHHAPRRTSDGTRRARLSATSVPSALLSAVTPPSNRLFALLAVAKAQITTASKLRSKSIRRTLSTMLAGRNERDHLLHQLLEWAKHDKSSLISEPRDNQLRWRSQFEWQALREEEAHLGARDTTERAAYFKFRFLFADYSCHAVRAHRMRCAAAACFTPALTRRFLSCSGIGKPLVGKRMRLACCGAEIRTLLARRESVDLFQKLFLTSISACMRVWHCLRSWFGSRAACCLLRQLPSSRRAPPCK